MTPIDRNRSTKCERCNLKCAQDEAYEPASNADDPSDVDRHEPKGLPSRFSRHRPGLMKNLVILLVAAVIVAGGYGYNKNPKACQKLGSDIANDIAVIFTKSDSTKQDGMSTAATTPAAPVVSPSSVPVVAPSTPTAAPQPQVDPMAGNLLQNGDFSNSNNRWEGDGKTNPSFGKGLIVQLSPNSWTKVWQDFKGDQGVSDTLTLTYKVSPDLTVSDKQEDYANILPRIQFEDYQGYGPVGIPTGYFLAWIGDLTNHASRYERYRVKPDIGDTQKIAHTFPNSLPLADKMVTLAFPPGTGNVVILSVSVTSK
jgi:hypothetical protein